MEILRVFPLSKARNGEDKRARCIDLIQKKVLVKEFLLGQRVPVNFGSNASLRPPLSSVAAAARTRPREIPQRSVKELQLLQHKNQISSDFYETS